jgi:hypothetical protein
MRRLAESIVPALVAVVAVLALHPVLSGGYAEAQAGAPDTGRGVRCEELQLSAGADKTFVIRCVLADFGGPFQIVHASLLPNPTVDDPDDKPILMSGTGQIISSQKGATPHRVFYMNLHYSQEHADQSPYKYWHDGRIAQVSLDLSTLKGSFWMIGTDYDAATAQYDAGYDNLDVTLAGPLPDCLRESSVPEGQ